MKQAGGRMARIVLGGLVGLVGWAGPALACSCTNTGWTPTDYLEHSTLAFEGQVLSIEAHPQRSGYLVVTFDVTGCWRGVDDSQVEVVTAETEAACGYPFVVLERYVVFTGSFDGFNDWTGLCFGNVPRAQADAYLEELGNPDPPGQCLTTPVEPQTWGRVKARYGRRPHF